MNIDKKGKNIFLYILFFEKHLFKNTLQFENNSQT